MNTGAPVRSCVFCVQRGMWSCLLLSSTARPAHLLPPVPLAVSRCWSRGARRQRPWQGNALKPGRTHCTLRPRFGWDCP